MDYTPIVPASCATTTDCQDTGTPTDVSWLLIPGVILVIVVTVVLVYFTVKGSRGR